MPPTPTETLIAGGAVSLCMGFRPEVSYALRRRVEQQAVEIAGDGMESEGFGSQVEAVLEATET